MAVASHLFFVNSRPSQVSDKAWVEWYTKEHMPELVSSELFNTAAFYEEFEVPGAGATADQRRYLAIYQTDYRDVMKAESFGKLRLTSDLFKQNGADSDVMMDNGDFEGRYYDLVQVYDPKSVGNQPAPEILTAEMHPKDPADHDKWYREEHLELLSKIPGYRRTVRYSAGAPTPMTKADPVPSALAIHEFEDAGKAFATKELAAASDTEWTKKHMKESDPYVARGWRLIASEGF